MAMKNPPHPGEIIREQIIKALGLTVTSAAEILGVRRATLSDVTNGKASVSAEMALRLEKAFGVSMDLLLKMQAGYDAAQARMHGDQIKVKRYKPANARQESPD
ncbi:MAG: addiction module antidote protein, HigA family [Deltaproteobacteria bacterium GWA2_57_13]|nr:MAG: addiction module antidote protein, HigA family [Deltaproteobacteria bacterium GWA2_57_13]OGQ50574.1 MAG: addiction module antidote protein, HigA family [Deltaproteobacteria bacterium RIFCSPLOWO2_02_FULL_57_26]